MEGHRMGLTEHGLDWTPKELWARTDRDILIRLHDCVERGWICREGYNPNDCERLWPDHKENGCGPTIFIQVPPNEEQS
jgi:hypothetical protein